MKETKTKKEIKQQFKLVYIIVNKGFAEEVVTKTKNVGATGATIISARGSAGVKSNFMGMKVEPEKEIILIVINENNVLALTELISTEFGHNSNASGICFSLPVEEMTALKHFNKE